MKVYGFNTKPTIIKYNSSIRSKNSIIKLLVEILRYLIVSKTPLALKSLEDVEKGQIQVVIYIDKMSRIFIVEENKIHSFYFPFTIRVEDGRYQLFFYDYVFTNVTCSVLAAVFENMSDDESIERIIDEYWNSIDDLEILDEDKNMYSQLITYLLSFEPGYLRFDHDEDEAHQQKGDVHPVNHIDINYTGAATFKLGLKQAVNFQELIDIVNITTDCQYLSSEKKK